MSVKPFDELEAEILRSLAAYRKINEDCTTARTNLHEGRIQAHAIEGVLFKLNEVKPKDAASAILHVHGCLDSRMAHNERIEEQIKNLVDLRAKASDRVRASSEALQALQKVEADFKVASAEIPKENS